MRPLSVREGGASRCSAPEIAGATISPAFRAERFAASVIHANDLLVPGDDARLYGVTRFRSATILCPRCLPREHFTRTGFLGRSHQLQPSLRARRYLRQHFPRHKAFSTRRNPTGTAASGERREAIPRIPIEHQVSQDADTLSAHAGGYPSSGKWNRDIVGHDLPNYSGATFASSGSITGMSSRTG